MLFENVKRICKERGVSFWRLEHDLGFGNGTIGKWSTSVPSLDKAAAVAKYFGVTVDELLADREGA